MSFRAFSVSVPATSANLGPGYDSCGIALDLRDRVSVTALDAGAETRVSITGEGESSLPRDESHLVVRVLRHTLRELGVAAAEIPLALACENVIPHSRGLGSSASAVVAGITAGYAIAEQLAGVEPDPENALRIAVSYEGHPDNAAPALRGGATLSIGGARPLTVDLRLHPGLGVVLLVPDFSLDTSVARALLPTEVPHADAVENSARAALLVHALAVGGPYLFEATSDRLHQEYRRSVMPETLGVVDALRGAGLAAAVSGAGPSVAVFGAGDSEALAAEVRAALPDRLTSLFAVSSRAVAARGAEVCYSLG